MKIPCLLSDKIELTDYWASKMRQLVKDAGSPVRGEIHVLTPESSNLRRYVFGCLIKLLIYMDGNDHKDAKVSEYYFENYKRELSPEVIKINGKVQVFGKSTKGSRALKSFAEKLQDVLHDEYGIRRDNKALSPDEYKKFAEEIYSFSGDYEDFVDYAVKLGWINKDKE